MAALATERIPLDLLYFIPSYQAPLKEHQPFAAPAHRVAMVELLTAMRDNWVVQTYEIEQERPVATIETIDHFGSSDPDASYYLIIGGDQLAQFHRWKQADQLAKKVQILCFTRAGVQQTDRQNKANATIIPFRMGVSSSAIRDRISKGESPEEFLSPEIFSYIQIHKLYQ